MNKYVTCRLHRLPLRVLSCESRCSSDETEALSLGGPVLLVTPLTCGCKGGERRGGKPSAGAGAEAGCGGQGGGGKAAAKASLPAAGRALRGASARLAALGATGRAHEP